MSYKRTALSLLLHKHNCVKLIPTAALRLSEEVNFQEGSVQNGVPVSFSIIVTQFYVQGSLRSRGQTLKSALTAVSVAVCDTLAGTPPSQPGSGLGLVGKACQLELAPEKPRQMRLVHMCLGCFAPHWIKKN